MPVGLVAHRRCAPARLRLCVSAQVQIYDLQDFSFSYALGDVMTLFKVRSGGRGRFCACAA